MESIHFFLDIKTQLEKDLHLGKYIHKYNFEKYKNHDTVQIFNDYISLVTDPICIYRKQRLLNDIKKYLYQNCPHEWETDWIEDCSSHITMIQYCKICEECK